MFIFELVSPGKFLLGLTATAFIFGAVAANHLWLGFSVRGLGTMFIFELVSPGKFLLGLAATAFIFGAVAANHLWLGFSGTGGSETMFIFELVSPSKFLLGYLVLSTFTWMRSPLHDFAAQTQGYCWRISPG
ncbi:hypothetical protein Hypma_000104 [Hypsizygus marmoreus]|uniref:Uncharacterized protein n=1 Tax=Hypsizygus marmoreus TaxID=39966 RepID=A0A369KAT6_HYPMA|nr:hypothetical protein Hypma_000104 [Hypsizygus marmoreus]